MIALQPDFEQVAKATVAADVACGQVGVVIDDRLGFRVMVIKSLCGCGMQQEVFVNEAQNTAPIWPAPGGLFKNQNITESQALCWQGEISCLYRWELYNRLPNSSRLKLT